MGEYGDSDVVPDDGLIRRLKALACTAPLNDLDSRKSHLEWVDGSIYQMAEIGLHVIDQVTIAMDFDAGADAEQIIARTVPLVAMQGSRPYQRGTRPGCPVGA
ncbi:hypothetical protein [Micromonospora sp. WMMA1976]|uniref:hypothetical protein n=1 Tax=Micromonospora sp. WMMA1976 TaxID=3014995 RepID=UPI00248AD9F5|nr:hypothetical protein [Micromonospora sp. WMMA1976]WBC04754.1 hypothetical protein O7546_07270 [Micromonospora sp. WMMA1976]